MNGIQSDSAEEYVLVRLVLDQRNPLVIPCDASSNHNAPHVCTVPARLVKEWDTVWERAKELQAFLRHYYGSSDDGGSSL